MEVRKISKLKMITLIVVPLVATLLYTYYYFIGSYLRFTEQIELSDGTKVLIDRKVKLSSYSEFGGESGWDAKFNSFKVVEPMNATHLNVWQINGDIMPLLFDYDREKKEWFVVSVIRSCYEQGQQGKPKLPYVEDRYINGNWKRVQLSPELIGRHANILVGVRITGEISPVLNGSKLIRMSEIGILKDYIEVNRNARSCWK